VLEEFDVDHTEPPMSVIEMDALKQVSNNVDFDFDSHSNDRIDLSKLSMDAQESQFNNSQPTLEQQSDELLLEYNPSVISDEDYELEDDFDIQYWPVNKETPHTEESLPSSTHQYNLRPRTKVLAVTSKNLTPKQGIELGSVGKDSITKELQNMINFKVWDAVHKCDIDRDKLNTIIRSKMFLRQKRTGVIKSRLVAGGHMQDRETYTIENTSSPTVSTDALLILLAKFASDKRHTVSIDIVAAYLNCDLIKDVYMVLDKLMSELLIEVDQNYRKYLDPVTNCIYVKLKKALYGLIESAKLFYIHLSNSLESLGFVRNGYDQCVFNRVGKSGKQLTVCFHVDDLLCASESNEDLELFATELNMIYTDININRGMKHDYLGIDIDFSESGFCAIDMTKYIQDIITTHNVEGTKTSPADDDLFKVDNNSEILNVNDKDMFHSIVAKLLYVTKRARGDILTTVAYLTTRVLTPTISDWNKLGRLLQYLNHSKHLVMRLNANDDDVVRCFVDASYNNHPDGKSHSGCVVSLGSGAVYCKSSKQKLVTTSSTEAELVAISDCISVGVWARNFLQEQKTGTHELNELNTLPPVMLFQDNTSTIILANKGRSTSARTRHVDLRYFWIKDRISQGQVVIEYLCTDRMIADIMTKPLQGKKFLEMRRMLLNDRD
jgi:Reverse transcriptase (RNA-dependent DNA polymerase)